MAEGHSLGKGVTPGLPAMSWELLMEKPQGLSHGRKESGPTPPPPLHPQDLNFYLL